MTTTTTTCVNCTWRRIPQHHLYCDVCAKDLNVTITGQAKPSNAHYRPQPVVQQRMCRVCFCNPCACYRYGRRR